jgi:hypothetical protein
MECGETELSRMTVAFPLQRKNGSIVLRFEAGVRRSLPLLSITMEGMAPPSPILEPQTIPEQETWNVGSRGCLLSCGVSIVA